MYRLTPQPSTIVWIASRVPYLSSRRRESAANKLQSHGRSPYFHRLCYCYSHWTCLTYHIAATTSVWIIVLILPHLFHSVWIITLILQNYLIYLIISWIIVLILRHLSNFSCLQSIPLRRLYLFYFFSLNNSNLFNFIYLISHVFNPSRCDASTRRGAAGQRWKPESKW